MKRYDAQIKQMRYRSCVSQFTAASPNSKASSTAMASSTDGMRHGLISERIMMTIWQVNVGKHFGEDCWTDLDEVTTRALEVSWREGHQVPLTVDKWPNYKYFVGVQLQQTNETTGKERSLRRLLILVQDLSEQEASSQGSLMNVWRERRNVRVVVGRRMGGMAKPGYKRRVHIE